MYILKLLETNILTIREGRWKYGMSEEEESCGSGLKLGPYD